MNKDKDDFNKFVITFIFFVVVYFFMTIKVAAKDYPSGKEARIEYEKSKLD